MKKIKVIHLASFNGNVGDNFNHAGFRPWFEKLTKNKIFWKNQEIREFYWKKKKWDLNFVNYVNKFDLLIIGGGNYFELWVNNSPTGTSIAIPIEIFKKIKIPIFFNSLGVDLGQGATQIAIDKFNKFLDVILCDEKNIVSIRNDGSKKNLKKIYKSINYKKIYFCPDHGFFVNKKFFKNNKTEFLRLSVNLACDMAEIRFKNFGKKNRQLQNFCKEMSLFINDLCVKYSKLTVYLIPHIYSDIQVYNEILKFLPDEIRRKKIVLAEFGSGNHAANKILEYYSRSDLILGTRFHANVSSIGLLKDTLGLKNYPQIENLYNELRQPQRVVDISKPSFKVKLLKKIDQILKEKKQKISDIRKIFLKVKKDRYIFSKNLIHWLKKNKLY